MMLTWSEKLSVTLWLGHNARLWKGSEAVNNMVFFFPAKWAFSDLS